MSDTPETRLPVDDQPVRPQASVEPSQPNGSAGRSSRRRLLKAGLTAVPMILTLRGRPAHGEDERTPIPNGSGGFITGSAGSTLPQTDENSSFLDDDPSGWARNRWLGDQTRRSEGGEEDTEGEPDAGAY